MSDNKKQRGMLPNLYLFTSEYENNEPVGPLDVVTNTFIFWGDPNEVDLENQGRVLMRTDEVGCIHHTIETVKDFESMTGLTGKPVMDYSASFKGMMINKYMKDGKRDDVPQPLLLPPADALSYIALSTPEGSDRRKGMGCDFPLPPAPSRKGRGSGSSLCPGSGGWVCVGYFTDRLPVKAPSLDGRGLGEGDFLAGE